MFQATNGAGLTSLASSKPFVVDRSPPGGGVIRSSAFNSSVSRMDDGSPIFTEGDEDRQ